MIDQSALPPTKRVRLEFFPAAVDIPGTQMPPGDLKAVVTDTHLLILANSSKGPTVAFSDALEDYSGYDKTTKAFQATLEDGTPVSISRADSCGCGSALRGVRLYPAAPRMT